MSRSRPKLVANPRPLSGGTGAPHLAFGAEPALRPSPVRCFRRKRDRIGARIMRGLIHEALERPIGFSPVRPSAASRAERLNFASSLEMAGTFRTPTLYRWIVAGNGERVVGHAGLSFRHKEGSRDLRRPAGRRMMLHYRHRASIVEDHAQRLNSGRTESKRASSARTIFSG
jgi:hypothetical protein